MGILLEGETSDGSTVLGEGVDMRESCRVPHVNDARSVAARLAHRYSYNTLFIYSFSFYYYNIAGSDQF